MPRFTIDLHNHTLLSPCGDLSMSPAVIVETAQRQGLDAIAITDHNSTLQVDTIRAIGKRNGLMVYWGVEITTKEEAHCVALLPDGDAAAELQKYIDAHILKIENDPEKLGDQIWVDEDENIGGEVEWYLNSPVDKSVEDIAEEVHRLEGLFIPAHVDREANSLIWQLGFIPPYVKVDAIEYNFEDKLERLINGGHKYLTKHTLYTASDAHYPNMIGMRPTTIEAENRSFKSLTEALRKEK